MDYQIRIAGIRAVITGSHRRIRRRPMAALQLSGTALGVIELVKSAAHDLRARKNARGRKFSKLA